MTDWEKNFREAAERVEKLESIARAQHRLIERMSADVVRLGGEVPETAVGYQGIVLLSPSAPAVVDPMAGLLEHWERMHRQNAVRTLNEFDADWRRLDLEALLASQELGLQLYRAKRRVDGGGLDTDIDLPRRDWHAPSHLEADQAIARWEKGLVVLGRLDDEVDAYIEAVRRWGVTAGTWMTSQSTGPLCHVGVYGELGFEARGQGATWEAAFG